MPLAYGLSNAIPAFVRRCFGMGQNFSCNLLRENCMVSRDGRRKQPTPRPRAKVVLDDAGEVPGMPTDPVEFVAKFIELRTAREADACAALVADDIEIVTPFGRIRDKRNARDDFGKPVPSNVASSRLHLQDGSESIVIRDLVIAKGPLTVEYVQYYKLTTLPSGKLRLQRMDMQYGKSNSGTSAPNSNR